MSDLVYFFSTYNKQVYGKFIRVAKKNTARFEQVEEMLKKSGISPEDYALTTFADRADIGVKLGFLPANVFISENSLKNYVSRLEQGCEVTKKKEYSTETDWLNIEMAYTSKYILNIKHGYGWSIEEIEFHATTYGWTSNPNRTADLIEQVRKMQCQIHRCPANWTLDQIGAMEIERKKYNEAKHPKPGPRIDAPRAKPKPKKDWRFWRHPDEAPEEDVD